MLPAYGRRLREQGAGMLKGGRRFWKAIVIAVAVGVLVLASWMYVRSGFGALAGISSRSMVVHMDFDIFWHSARALWEERSLYYDTGGRTAALTRLFGPCWCRHSGSWSR